MKTNTITLLALVSSLLAIPATGFGQGADSPPGGRELRSSSMEHPFRTPSRRNLGLLAENPNIFNSRDIYRLLDYPSVQRELDLVSDQLSDFKQIQDQIRKERRELLREMTSVTRQKASDGKSDSKVRENILQKRKEIQERLSEIELKKKDVLLDHQDERLQQIAAQLKLQSRGVYGALSDESMMEKLDIDDAQMDELRDAATEMAKELEEKIAELKKDYRKKLIDKLRPAQREKLKKMIGEPFDLYAKPALGSNDK